MARPVGARGHRSSGRGRPPDEVPSWAPEPGTLGAQVREFVEFLRYNRNASPHTARAYESDLQQFLAHVGASRGQRRSALHVSDVTPDAIRVFLAELYRLGNQGNRRAQTGGGALVRALSPARGTPRHRSGRNHRLAQT